MQLDLRQTSAYAEFVERCGWVVETNDTSVVFLKKLPVLPFYVLKLQRVQPEKLDLDWLDVISSKYRLLRRYVELAVVADSVDALNGKMKAVDEKLHDAGYAVTRSGMLPTKTRVIDLRVSEDELLAQMHHKTRYNIGLAQRKNLQVFVVDGRQLITSADWHAASEMLVRNAKRVGYWGVDEKRLEELVTAFGSDVFLVVIRRHSKLLAGAIFLVAGDVVYYSYNGSTNEGRVLQAPTLAVWKGMQEAQQREMRTLDLDGVLDERQPLKRWEGFSRFKRSFGGVAKYYPFPYRRFR